MRLALLKDNVMGDKHAAGGDILDFVIPGPTGISQETALYPSRIQF